MTENNYRAFKAIWLCCLGFTIAMLAQRADRLMHDLDRDEGEVATRSIGALAGLQTALVAVQNIETDTQRTEAEMAGLLNQTRRSLTTPEQTKELVDRTARVLDNANESMIGLREAIENTKGIPPTVQGAIQQFAEDSHNTMQGSQALMAAATADLDDPAIKDSLKHIDATATNADATTADVKKIADEWAAPVKGTWNHIKMFLFEAAGPLASIATAIK